MGGFMIGGISRLRQQKIMVLYVKQLPIVVGTLPEWLTASPVIIGASGCMRVSSNLPGVACFLHSAVVDTGTSGPAAACLFLPPDFLEITSATAD